MPPATIVALVALLAGVLLLVVAAMVWQEAKRRTVPGEVTYVIEDAVDLVRERLDEPAASRLRKAGIRRILQWEVYYLQGLAQPNRRNPVETVAGGAEAAVAYIADRIETVHGVTYPQEDIRAVLRLEAEYLAQIGAIGAPVEGGTAGGDHS